MWKIVKGLRQGSPEWIAHRAQHLNASDAPAMMAVSPNRHRRELVRQLATGNGPEFSDFVQERILDKGHEFERLAGHLMDELVGETLYPVVGTNGKYGASYDGLTMMEDVAAEHKRLNNAIRDALSRPQSTGSDLPMCYQVQMEHQAMVCPTVERILFVASDWNAAGELIEERHCWYTPNLQLRAQILAGWELLEQDVAAYAPAVAIAEKPAAKLRESLPALRVEATGQITASNVDEFKLVVLERVNSVNMELVTDDDFANGDADAKWLREVSTGMKQAVQRVRSGMHTVDAVLQVLEQLDQIATNKALAIEKKVKSEKDVRKDKIVMTAEQQLAKHIEGLNATLGANYLAPPQRGIFAPVTKGLKSLQSMEDKVRAALGPAIAEATAAASRLTANRAHLKQADGDWITLFPDFAAVGGKAAEDFQALAALRVGNHRAAEATRLEAERAQIRNEEEARAAAAVSLPQHNEVSAPAVAANVVRMRSAPSTATVAPVARTGVPTLRIGVINDRLKNYETTADKLKGLGFEPAGRERAAPLYYESDFPSICDAFAARAMEAKQAFLQAQAAEAARHA